MIRRLKETYLRREPGFCRPESTTVAGRARPMRRLLTTALAGAMLLQQVPVFAAPGYGHGGGGGVSRNESGGAGGSLGMAGDDGSSGSGGGGGGAGGGAGGSGGAGGTGTPGSGGAGGVGAGGAGARGGDGTGTSGAGGGGGGAHGNGAGAAQITNTSPLVGGSGGDGGDGAAGGDEETGGGGGGAGGFGALVTGDGNSTNSSSITGGAGGAGGIADYENGSGGDGGVGVFFQSPDAIFENSGTVIGGVGGFGVYGGTGGDGIRGAGLTVINSGSIIGGLGGNGAISGSDGHAIYFESGNNTLELRHGSTIVGNVVANGVGTNTLRLGGSTNASFDTLTMPQYQGFTVFEKSGTSTWTLSGAGSLAGFTSFNINAGTLALTNNNQLSSGTVTIDNGATLDLGSGINATNQVISGLNLTNGNITGTGQLQALGPANLVSGSVDVNLFLVSAVTKSGTGTVTLSGQNFVIGGLSVTEGRLYENGTRAGGSVLGTTVADGATYGGSGTFNHLLNNIAIQSGGTFDPGSGVNQVGTYTASSLTMPYSTLALQSGSTMHVDFDGSHSDLAAVQVVNIQSGSSLFVHGVTGSGSAVAGPTRYTFIQTTQGLTGMFDTVSDDLPMLNVVVEYDAFSASFFLESSGGFYQTVGGTANEKSVGGALDMAGGNANGDTQMLLSELNTLNTAQLQNALNQLSGEAHSSTSQATIEQNTASMRTTSDYLRTSGDNNADPTMVMRMPDPQQLFSRMSPGQGMGGDPYAAPVTFKSREIDLVNYDSVGKRLKDEPKDLITTVSMVSSLERTWDVWTVGYGTYGQIDGDGNASGIHYNVGGANFGVGYYLDDETVVGVLGGYAVSNVNGGGNGNDHAQVDTLQGGLYARKAVDDHYVLGIVTYGRQDTDARRNLVFGGIDREAKSNYNGDELATWVEYGQNRQFETFVLQPLVALQYVGLWQDGFSESGAGAANLTVGDRQSDSLRGSLGARLLKPYEYDNGLVIIPEVSARWMHEFLDQGQEQQAQFGGVPGAQFTTRGATAGRDFAVFGTGATFRLSEMLSLNAHYFGQANDQFLSHTGLGGFTATW